MSIISKWWGLAALLVLMGWAGAASAQNSTLQLCTPDPSSGRCISVNGNNPFPITTNVQGAQTTTNNSIVIGTGNTFQQIMPANTARKALTLVNNNSNGDTCWIYIGGGSASKNASIPLAQNSQYFRNTGPIPGDVIQATCTTSADTLYADQE